MAARLLPYGSTLHYPGCGCPSGWRTHRRLADAVDSQLQAAVKAMQSGRVVPSRKLNVAYMLPHHNVTGGMKCLVEHIRLLKTRGHRHGTPSSSAHHSSSPACNFLPSLVAVSDPQRIFSLPCRTIAVHRSDAANRAMPPWTSVEADVDIVCRLNQQLQDVFDVSTIDVVVVGIFHQVIPIPIPLIMMMRRRMMMMMMRTTKTMLLLLMMMMMTMRTTMRMRMRIIMRVMMRI